MYPYRIRLAGPWEYRLLDQTPPVAGRMTIPCHWKGSEAGRMTGPVRFMRRFGRPRQLDDHERVWLTFAGVGGTAAVSLNGALLGRQDGEEGPFEFPVPTLLRARNELVVDLEAAERGGLWGEVALEIRGPAFLRGVRTVAEAGRLYVCGEVVGDAAGPLELYVLRNGATVVYTQVTATPLGAPFTVDAGQAPANAERIRVDLVNGAVTWHAVELT